MYHHRYDSKVKDCGLTFFDILNTICRLKNVALSEILLNNWEFSKNVEYCRIITNIIKLCQILLNNVEYCQIMSIDIEKCCAPL